MLRTTMIAALIAALAAPGLSGSKAASAVPPRMKPVMVAGALDPALRGVWHDPGNGWVLDFSGKEAALYNQTKVDCLRDPVSPENIVDYLASYWSGSTRAIRLASRPDAGLYRFERIAALPEVCRKAPAPTASNTFNSLVASFSEHYPDFKVRGIDWPRSVAAARARIRDGMSDAELFAVMSDLLRPLDDSHVTLDAKDGRLYFEEGSGRTLGGYFRDRRSPGFPDRNKMRAAFMKSWTDSVQAQLLGGTGTKAANGRLYYGTVAPGVAYLAPTTFYDTATGLGWREEDAEYGRTLDKAFTSFAGAKALIIDLSNHRGGSPLMGRQIASRVAQRAAVGAYFQLAHPRGQARDPWAVVPERKRPRFDGPVYVLVSDVTVSAGEFTALLLRALPNVLVIGERTRGSLSGLVDKHLPNGWKMEMPNQFIVTAKGEDFAAVGIPPEVPLAVYSGGGSPIAAHRAAVRTVAARIQGCGTVAPATSPCW